MAASVFVRVKAIVAQSHRVANSASRYPTLPYSYIMLSPYMWSLMPAGSWAFTEESQPLTVDRDAEVFHVNGAVLELGFAHVHPMVEIMVG